MDLKWRLSYMARMKKAKFGAAQSVDEYLAGVPEPARSTLKRCGWRFGPHYHRTQPRPISYKIPAFKRENILVWFAAFSYHCSLFPTASVIEEFKDELKASLPPREVSTSRWTSRCPLHS